MSQAFAARHPMSPEVAAMSLEDIAAHILKEMKE